MLETMTPAARPILKWAGGKTQLLPEIFVRRPKVFTTYHEPFLGSGAVLFALSPDRATISDTNRHLINLYTQVRDNLQPLDAELRLLEQEFNDLRLEDKAEYYYLKRTVFNAASEDNIHQAALMVFLNKTGFNGMYRENPKGHFNIPFAKKSKVNLPTRDQLESCKAVLGRSDILQQPFDSIVDRAKPGDFVYFDPPYVPLNKTSSFTSYQANGFGLSDHEKLAHTFRDLDKAKVQVLLSNSDTPVVRELFQDFIVETVYARRNINSKGSGRGAVAEVLIRNY